MNDVIAIPTHITGVQFLDNLLSSLKGFDKYPIIIVINDHKEANLASFLDIKKKFNKLPITIITLPTNSFEFGGLYAAYQFTNYNDIFLLPHSCEIVNTDLFDMVFDLHRNKSVAFALMDSCWGKGIWHSHVGKYRRLILDKMNLSDYLPRDMNEAIEKSEAIFTTRYHALDKDTVVLFPDWVNADVFEEKFGKLRMKIANEYIIKWKTHWNSNMVRDDMAKTNPPKRSIRKTIKHIRSKLLS